MILSPFFIVLVLGYMFFIVSPALVQEVEAPVNKQIIIIQEVAWVPQLDGSWKHVLVNILPIDIRGENRIGYYSHDLDSIFVDFNHRKVGVNSIWTGDGDRCWAVLFHELEHARLAEQNINTFDQHEWMKIKFKCY